MYKTGDEKLPVFIKNNKLSIMKKSILSLGKALNKKEQQKINGGICDIAPPGCPCIVPPNHPCLSGGSGGGEDTGVCFTPLGPIQVPCNQTCPNGSAPIC